MSEVLLLDAPAPQRALQGFLAHKKTPPPLGPPEAHRYRANVGTSRGGAISYERGTPVNAPAEVRLPIREHPL